MQRCRLARSVGNCRKQRRCLRVSDGLPFLNPQGKSSRRYVHNRESDGPAGDAVGTATTVRADYWNCACSKVRLCHGHYKGYCNARLSRN